MRTSMNVIFASALCMAFLGCTAEMPESPTPSALSKDDARAMAGKQDGWDLCEWFGWYGDGECDEFCSEPDPDCEGTCRVDDDCPRIVCVRAPCPSTVCERGECVFDNPEDRCDAGERECQTCGDNFVCAPHEVSCPLVHCEPPPADRCDAGERECQTCGDNFVCAPNTVSCPLVHCAPPTESCGGFAGTVCSDPDQYCNYDADASCGFADQTGTCQDRPEACTRDFRPVCGCDGSTYSNACSANAAGTSVAREGECDTPTVGCKRSGCSSQLCVPEDSPDIFTTCEFRAEYACYAAATCERQADGSCGHTDSPALAACLGS